VPVAGLAEALPLMADAAQRPTFPTQQLEILRQQRLATLRNARGDPDAIAALAFARGSYGPSHRSAAALIGTAESLQALTSDDLRTFHAAAYRPGTSTLIVVGDLAPDQVLPLLETHFGKWQPPGVNRVAEPAPALQRPARQLLLVDLPGAPQSRILVGGVGGPNSYADFFPIQVLTTIARGRLSADRNATLRDYTAGVRSGFDMRTSATPFVVSAAAQVEKTADSLKALVNELGGMVKGIPADELARAKADAAAQFPRTLEPTGRISSRLRTLESLLVHGLPDGYYANYAAAIQAVGSGDVQRVAQQYIHPDHLTIVIVGDRKTIEPSIRALNLGTIKAMGIDEVFTPAR
jgi:zinc protease